MILQSADQFAKMRTTIIFLLSIFSTIPGFEVVPNSGTPASPPVLSVGESKPSGETKATGEETAEHVIDEIIKTGEYPDPVEGISDQDMEKKIKEENGIDKMDPALYEEYKGLASQIYENSEELKGSFEEMKANGNLSDRTERNKVNRVYWAELGKNKKTYGPKMEELGKKTPPNLKDKVKNRLAKTWKGIKNLPQNLQQSLQNVPGIQNIANRRVSTTPGHNIRLIRKKRGLLILLIIIVVVSVIIFAIIFILFGILIIG